MPWVTPRSRRSASRSTAPGSGAALGQQLAEQLAVAVLDGARLVVGRSRPSSRPTARVNRPPLMPIRRWMRQPSIAMPRSPSARCQAKTCA